VADIEAAAAKLRSETKAVVLGPDAVQAQKPEDRPARPKKSYAPGRPGGKLPVGKLALRSPERSFSEASRKAAKNK
jgi:hypothetical protein